MNYGFKFGVISASFLLIKIHLLVAMIISVILNNSVNLGEIAELAAIAYLLIAGIGHIRCSLKSFSQMNNPNLFNKSLEEPETIDEALNPKKNHAVLGMVWRMTQEWLYMKKTANLNFKA